MKMPGKLRNDSSNSVPSKSGSPEIISDEELVLIPVKDLNKLLKLKRYSKAEINSMKQKRRTLKNRGYAASCRIKKIEQKDELEVKKTAEWSEMEEMQDETRNFKKECDTISLQYEALKKFAIHHKISIPPELDVLEVIYVNTKYGFNPERLREIAIKSGHIYNNLKSASAKLKEFDSYFKIEDIMKKIHYIQVVTDVEFIAAINILENWLQMNKNIKLIIVDSITAPIRFAAIEKRAEILNNVLYNLKLLAQRYNLAVVITNEMTTKISSVNEISTVPSFGSSYYHKVNTRIQLCKLSRDVFKAMLIKSASKPFREVSFQLAL
ncbi:DNA repair protein RAD51 homolog 3 isoform X2 [Agrilus planipennis]|uniref:DNA repair protein RAD51 homolog 3 isoform X2 n=1 Tax=Agrilus planipennis TaxID=224129 RepID=A0A7F5RM53_AGRPL|nr:DNA repair protein RAD51 homolog 3 isoform X2 [Agrilus planipennis]